MLKYVLTAMVIAAGSLAQAQDGPSYEETVRYILERVNTHSNFTLSETSRCNFEATDVSHIPINGIRRNYALWVNLDQLDPSRVDGRVSDLEGIVRMDAFSGAFAINRRYDNINRNGFLVSSEHISNMEFFFVRVRHDYRDVTPRVARAFRHLILMCGGREGLF